MNTPIDSSNLPELVDLVEEVATTKKPRELKRDDKIVAILTPTEKPATTSLMDVFGSWKDVDTDRLKEDIYADRTRNAQIPHP
jgi:hypothetical protein